MSFGLGYGMPESFTIKQPDPPGVNGVATLFDSAAMFGGHQLRQMNATMLELTFQVLAADSAASGLIAYSSTNGGTTYTQNNIKDANGTDTLPIQVTSAGIPRTYSFVLSPYDDFKLTYTNGLTALASWTLTLTLHCGVLSVSR